MEAQVPLRTFLIRVNPIHIKLTNNRAQLQAIAADCHPLLSMRASAHCRERDSERVVGLTDGKLNLDAPTDGWLHLLERDGKSGDLLGTGHAARLADR